MWKKMLSSLRDKLFSVYETHRLRSTAFIVITNNCWGYELYSSTGREYNTPFVGLFLLPECYIRFLENFNECINAELKFTDSSRYGNSIKHYPIGLLGHDIEIHFLHYASKEEALSKWNRRINRLKSEISKGAELYVKLCDCEGCTLEQLARFHALPFKNKLSQGLQKFDCAEHLHVPTMCHKPARVIFDGAKLFKKRYRYFDITTWVTSGKICHSLASRIFTLLS